MPIGINGGGGYFECYSSWSALLHAQLQNKETNEMMCRIRFKDFNSHLLFIIIEESS